MKASAPEHDLALLLGACVVLAISWRLLRALRQWAEWRGARRRARREIATHLAALTRRRMQLVRPDAYGKPVLDKWQREIDYFIEAHILPALRHRQGAALVRHRWRVAAEIDLAAKQAVTSQTALRAFAEDMEPAAFEAFCADELRGAGWSAWLTPPGADQGADVVAERGACRLVLQCKLHARPIGNKAVQEVTAARAHQRAAFAAVVSNRPYTRAARQLAAANDVFLLHFSELRELHGRLATTE